MGEDTDPHPLESPEYPDDRDLSRERRQMLSSNGGSHLSLSLSIVLTEQTVAYRIWMLQGKRRALGACRTYW